MTALVRYLFDGTWPIDELSQQPRPDPAARYLNRPCALGELMRRTMTY